MKDKDTKILEETYTQVSKKLKNHINQKVSYRKKLENMIKFLTVKMKHADDLVEYETQFGKESALPIVDEMWAAFYRTWSNFYDPYHVDDEDVYNDE